MRFAAVLFDNGGTLTHRTSPVAAVCALAARLGVEIGEEDAARCWRRSKEHSRSLMAAKRGRNLSRTDHRAAYVAGYAPFEEIAPGLADLMYDEWKTNPLTMVPYPDTFGVLKSFASAGVPIRKPVRPESTASWRTWVLSTPIPTTVRTARPARPPLVLLISATLTRDPGRRRSAAAASGVATTSSGRAGSARRPPAARASPCARRTHRGSPGGW